MNAIGLILKKSKLKYLFAACNNCGDRAAMAIADSLSQQRACQTHTINLTNNYLTDAVGKYIANALKDNKSLKRLYLSEN